MFGKMITAHESPFTHGADKFFLSGVCASVTGELVRAGKPLITPIPAAAEGLLTFERDKWGKEMSHAVLIKT